MANRTIWVVVANSARARVFRADRRERALELVREENYDSARIKGEDLLADRPGRTFDSAGQGRHAKEPRTDPKEVEKQKFAHHLAETLTSDADEHRFASLVLVTPPKLLGELRRLLPERVRGLVTVEMDKDLTQVSEHDLPEALAPHLWG
jgi:protein required for attachment to host cells